MDPGLCSFVSLAAKDMSQMSQNPQVFQCNAMPTNCGFVDQSDLILDKIGHYKHILTDIVDGEKHLSKKMDGVKDDVEILKSVSVCKLDQSSNEEILRQIRASKNDIVERFMPLGNRVDEMRADLREFHDDTKNLLYIMCGMMSVNILGVICLALKVLSKF